MSNARELKISTTDLILTATNQVETRSLQIQNLKPKPNPPPPDERQLKEERQLKTASPREESNRGIKTPIVNRIPPKCKQFF